MSEKSTWVQTLLVGLFVVILYFVLIYFIKPVWDALIDLVIPIYWTLFGSGRLADVDNPGIINLLFREIITAYFCSFFALSIPSKFPNANLKAVLIIFSSSLVMWASAFIMFGFSSGDWLLILSIAIIGFVIPMVPVFQFWQID